MRILIFILPIFFITRSISQNKKYDDTDLLIMVEGDSIATKSIDLKEITIYSPLNFKSIDDQIRYYTLKRKTLKVYPYALLASKRLEKLNSRLSLIKTRDQKKKYARVVERFMEKEFSNELKKLTRSEGQILIKLIYRETGLTVYKLVKKLRNGFRAFSYNSLAKIFDISIKTQYNPTINDEDAIIEDILNRAYADKSIKLSLKSKE
jgi:hypothetical protein